MPGLLDPSGAPVVGSRSPLPSSGAGPLSQEAILRALLLQKIQAQQAQPNLGLSPAANYLMNPRAVMDAQVRQAGG